MDIMQLGTTVAAITVICFLIGLAAKRIKMIPDETIPVIVIPVPIVFDSSSLDFAPKY